MEQVLLAAEEGRARRDTLRVPDANAAPSGKPRTSLHPQVDKPPVEVVAAAVTATPDVAVAETAHAEEPPDRGAFKKKRKGGGSGKGQGDHASPPAAPEAPEQVAEPLAEAPASQLSREPKKLAGGAGTGFDDDAEVDRVLLAKEFSGLLQVDSDGDEGSS